MDYRRKPLPAVSLPVEKQSNEKFPNTAPVAALVTGAEKHVYLDVVLLS